jgi:uncharacterized membrane protein
VSVVVLAAIAVQAALPDRVAAQPRWLLPAIAGLLLVGIIAANPRRVDRSSVPLRVATIALLAAISLANAWSAVRLIAALVNGTEGQDAGPLLVTGGAIWLTNIVVFSLWYWERDRGGPVARANGTDPYPDFLYAQMQNPELAPEHWEPKYVDYLYLSFTNATAFSPTDVLPLTAWAKLLMMTQSLISLSTVALVVRRGFGDGGQGGSASFDFGDDVVGGFGPDERFGVVVPVLGPGLDAFDERVDAGERAAA